VSSHLLARRRGGADRLQDAQARALQPLWPYPIRRPAGCLV